MQDWLQTKEKLTVEIIEETTPDGTKYEICNWKGLYAVVVHTKGIQYLQSLKKVIAAEKQNYKNVDKTGHWNNIDVAQKCLSHIKGQSLC